MKILSFFTKLLHFIPPEISHSLALNSLKVLYKLGLLSLISPPNKIAADKTIRNKENFLGIFRNKLGFAAGLDKNGDFIDCLAALGVGFIEVGTVTPLPQRGNNKPRLFRDRKEKSLVNKLGFNNKGVDHLVSNLKKRKTKVVIGASIGKNFNTPNDQAYKDYIICLEKLFESSDYIAINISSPNTENLRELSKKIYLRSLLTKIKHKQKSLSIAFGYRPIFIKISPDEELENLRDICNLILELQLDGIICSNTTLKLQDQSGEGGLSGAPLKSKATEKLLFIKEIVGDDIPIIASGGVMSVEDYHEKIDSGADLVQIYTGFIFEGPKLIQDLVKL